jgi:hypothetical protein
MRVSGEDNQGKSWSPVPSAISSRAQDSTSRSEGSTNLKGVPGTWKLYAFTTNAST